MASEETILSWNVTNWVTVILMAAIGFTIIGFGLKLYQNRSSASAS
jgi:hypothetical protein